MKIRKIQGDRTRQVGLACLFLLAFLLASFGAHVVDAACPSPLNDYGTATQTVNVTTAGTYRVWSRVMAPDDANNSFYLDVDDTTCGITIGDHPTPANSWTWIDYQNGDTSNKVTVMLTVGTHKLSYTGKEAGARLDRVLLLSDTTCTPVGAGDNCTTVSTDTIAPVVSVMSPDNGSNVTDTANVTSTATDNVGVTRIEFLVDGSLKSTDTSPPYSYSWNTKQVDSGAHTVSARAYDAANNNTTATVNVTVANAPTPPSEKQADVNRDGVVNAIDLSLLLSKWGSNDPAANLNGSGPIDLFDLSILLSKWGP